MAAKAGQVIIDFLLNTAKFESDIKQVSKTFKQIGRDLSTTGRELTKNITLPLVAIGAVATKAASDFESSFAGVRKTVNATEKEFALLSDGFRKMAKEIPVNVNELNRIGEAAGQLGIETKNILGFTRVMADLGVTTNLSSDQAATALARLANITQMPQDQFDRLGSTIVALGNNFATTESEIVEMGLRLAGAGKQIGLSEHQILSFAASLSSVGIEAEAGGSALSKVFINIASEVETSGKKLGMFASVAGMSAKQFQQAFREDAAGAINAFIAGLGRVEDSGGSTIQTLADLGIEEVRMRDAMLRVSGAGELVAKSLKIGADAWRENTALSKEATERYKTFQSQLILFKNELQDVAITLGKALLPILRDGLKALKPFVEWIADLAKAFAELPGPIQKTVIVLAGIAAAAGPVLMIMGSLATSIGRLIPIFVSTASHIAKFIHGMGGLSTALVTGAGQITMFGQVAVGLGAFWLGWELGKLLSKLEWVNTAGNAMADWILKIPGLMPDATNATNNLGASTQLLADKMKSFGVNVDRMANESIPAWADRVQKAAAEYKKLHPELATTEKKTESLTKATKSGTAAFVEGAGATNKAAEALKNLKEETVKALSPMDELAQKVETLISEGFDQHQVIKLFSDQIINASKKQLELTGKLTDGERALWAEAEAMQITKARAEAMGESFSLASDTAWDLTHVLSDLAVKEEKVNKEIRLSTDLWGDLHDTIKKGEPGLDGLANVDLPDIEANMKWVKEATGQAGDEAKETEKEMTQMGQTVSTTLTNMTQSLADKVVKWKGFFGDFARGAMSSFMEGLFNPIISKLTELGNIFSNWVNGVLNKLGSSLLNWVTGTLGKLFGFGGGGGGFSLSNIFGGGGNILSFLGIGGGAASGVGAAGATNAFTGFMGPMLGAGGAAGGTAAGAGAGGAAAGGGGGFMGSMGAFFTNPWTIGIGAAAGLGYLGYKFARGPNSWQAGSEEAMRDFKVELSDDTFQQLVESWGKQEDQIWDIRKDLLSAPQTLVNVLAPLAQQQGKMDAFLTSLESVSTAWGNFDFRTGFEQGMNTGDWSALNDMYVKAFSVSESLQKAMPDWQSKLLMVETATQESIDAMGMSATVMDENTIAITGNTDAIQKLIEQLTAANYPGLTIGGDQASVPALASGINYVPQDMLAYLHRGEAVVPASENGPRNITIRGGDMSLHFSISGGNQDDLVQTIKNKIIPILSHEMEGGNSALRESIRRAYDRTARAY